MEIFTVSFFGHRRIDNPLPVEKVLDALVGNLLRSREYVEFLVGRNGDFDQLVSSAIRRGKRTIRSDNSAHTWVLPYETADYHNHEEAYRDYYDEVEVFASGGGHYKAAIQERNRYMVDRSQFIVFYVERMEGGAYQTLRYAFTQKKPCLNLADNCTKYQLYI